jgi:hypothetical protein
MAMQQTRKTKIARPAARKSSGGRTKPSKSGTSKSSRKPEPTTQAAPEPQNPRRRFVELPKVAGELPTPTATFYF